MRPFLIIALLCAPVFAVPTTQGPPPRRVSVERPKTAAIERTIKVIGTARALQEATIQPRVSGYLATIGVEPGDILEKGREIGRIDAPELEAECNALVAAVREASALVLDARAQTEQARAGLAVSDSKVVLAHAEVGVAQADADMREVMATRVAAMHERGPTLSKRSRTAGSRTLASWSSSRRRASRAAPGSRSTCCARARLSAAERALGETGASTRVASTALASMLGLDQRERLAPKDAELRALDLVPDQDLDTLLQRSSLHPEVETARALFRASREEERSVRLEQTRRLIESRVIRAALQVDTSAQSIEASRSEGRAAREVFELARVRHLNGASLLIEVMEAELDQRRAESALVRSLSSFNRAQYDLLLAIGGDGAPDAP